MVQAGLGSGYAQQIITTEIADFLSHAEGSKLSPVNLDVRIAFNPNLTTAWFTSVMAVINNITMLAIILAGAAVVWEREHGTLDHLLVMPLTPFEIALSKVWRNGLVIAVAVALSLYGVLRMTLGIPAHRSRTYPCWSSPARWGMPASCTMRSGSAVRTGRVSPVRRRDISYWACCTMPWVTTILRRDPFVRCCT